MDAGKSDRIKFLGLLLRAVWRDELQGLFWEFPSERAAADIDGTARVKRTDHLIRQIADAESEEERTRAAEKLKAVFAPEAIDDLLQEHDLATMERDREPVDWEKLFECLSEFNGLPAGVNRDAPDFKHLASLDIESYEAAPRIAYIESIMIGLDDFSRWPGPPGIEPPVFWTAAEAAKAPVPEAGSPEDVVSTIGAIGDCREWLKGLMEAGPKENLKSEYRAEALVKYKGRLSGRGFIRAWDEAVEAVPKAKWNRSGPVPRESS